MSVGKLCRNALILFVLAVAGLAEDQATRLYQEGLRMEHAGDLLHAYLLYSQAAALNPSNAAIAEHKNQAAMLTAKSTGIHDATTEPDPDLAFLQLMQSDGPGQFDEFGPSAPAPHLASTGVKKSFDLRGDSTTIFTKVGDAFGIRMLFEPNYLNQPAFQFRTGELDIFEALRLLESMTTSLVEPVDQKTAMVVRDTPQRRAEVVPVVTIGIPIPERFVVQDAQEIVTAVQQALEIRRAQVDPGRRMVFLRDSLAKVQLARQLFADLSRLRSQVEVDVEILTVTKTSSLNVGLNLQNSSAIVNFGNFLQQTISPAGFTQFLTFGGGKSLFGIGVAAAQAFATLSKGATQSLLTAQVVALDGQPASLNVGSRYPIATAQFLGATAASTPTPTISFVDLGLVMKITPTVHSGGEMTLDVDAAVNTLGTFDGNGNPSIAQRKFQGKVRLGQNEWAVVAGLMQTNDATNDSGVAGLSSIPLLGHLFRTHDVEHDSDQTLILLKPRLVSLPPWDFPIATRDVGTEARFISLY